MFDLGKQFFFDAAHTLEREIAADSSRRIHGHTYRTEITVRGDMDPTTGMVIDLDLLEQSIAQVKPLLDHHFLNEVEGLGAPTVENLCLFIWRHLVPHFPGLSSVAIYRDSTTDWCIYRGPNGT